MEDFSSYNVEEAARMMELLSIYLLQGLSPEEQAEMEKLFELHPSYEELYKSLQDPVTREAMLEEYRQTTSASEAFEAFARTNNIPIGQILTIGTVTPWKKVLRYGAAAALIIAITGVAILYYHNQNKAVPVNIVQAIKDIPPGQDRATLTLADGKTVDLDKAHNGIIAQQGKTNIVNLPGGKLSYEGSDQGLPEPLLNTIRTPFGGQYLLVLSDGSRVWLNAGSSLTYPTSFPGPKREVQLQGEGYFEIARNVNSPFFVKTSTQEIQVLGTAFDVMAYTDEPSQTTTLVNGAVRVTTAGHQTQTLSPGQQLQINSASVQRIINDVNIREVTAWHNGQFKFVNRDLPYVMRQIARWYNVSVIFEGKVPEAHFFGTVTRYSNVSNVLQLLEQTGAVHFEVFKDKIAIKP